jgi:hypothetical protein
MQLPWPFNRDPLPLQFVLLLTASSSVVDSVKHPVLCQQWVIPCARSQAQTLLMISDAAATLKQPLADA